MKYLIYAFLAVTLIACNGGVVAPVVSVSCVQLDTYSEGDTYGTENGAQCVVDAETPLIQPAPVAEFTWQRLMGINAGGDAYTSSQGDAYQGDLYFIGGDLGQTSDSITQTPDATLYQTERWGEFNYEIPVAPGQYKVTLKLVEMYWNANGARLIDISVEGKSVAARLDTYATVGHDVAYDIEVPEFTVSDGSISIVVTAPVDNANLSAIDIYMYTDRPDPKKIASGKSIYLAQCRHCHGEKGDGNGLYPSLIENECTTCSTQESLVSIITATMPLDGPKCTDSCAADVATYIIDTFTEESLLYSDAPIATPTISRLSTLQWANTMADLFPQVDLGDLSNTVTKDAIVRFDNEADSLFVGQTLRDDFQTEAERIAQSVIDNSSALNALVPSGSPNDVSGKADAYINYFGRKVFRRPLTTNEKQNYKNLFNKGASLTSGLDDFKAGVKVTLEAFLQSPSFLYRTSFGGNMIDGRSRLTSHEIAANLAYALTNRPPDSLLSQAADTGALAFSTTLASEAERLLLTPAGKQAVDRFFFQYFGLGQYDTLQKDINISPGFTNDVGPMVHEETARILAYLFEQNKGFRDVFTTDVSFVNRKLADLYGLSGNFSENSWTQVNLDSNQRAGIFTRLGFLAYFGYQERPNTIKRGAYIVHRILCSDLSPPVGLIVPEVPPAQPNQTNREVIVNVTEECGSSCHKSLINPAGFAFENFDGLGQYRTLENGRSIDSSGIFLLTEGQKLFSDSSEFNSVLSESEDAHSCYAKKWAASILAREPRQDDEKISRELSMRSLSENLSTIDLIVALVTNEVFVTRVGEQ